MIRGWGWCRHFALRPPRPFGGSRTCSDCSSPATIEPVYQPIVRTTDLEPIGYEGLARFPYADGLSNMPPDVTLAAAAEIGLREDLEVACWAAMAAAGSPPSRRLLFVNISPDALRHPGLFMLADKLPSRLVIEITEQTDISDYARAARAARPLGRPRRPDRDRRHRRGLRVARARRRAAPGLPQAHARPGRRHRQGREPPGTAAGPGRLRPGGRRRDRRRGRRAPRGARGAAREPDRLRAGVAVRPARAGRGRRSPRSSRARRARPVSPSAVKRMSALDQAVSVAMTPTEAAQAAVDHLAGMGVLPSVYVQQGERLRCLASHGYYSLFDGITPEAGPRRPRLPHRHRRRRLGRQGRPGLPALGGHRQHVAQRPGPRRHARRRRRLRRVRHADRRRHGQGGRAGRGSPRPPVRRVRQARGRPAPASCSPAPPPAPRRWRTPTPSSARPPPPRSRCPAWSR